MAGNSERRGARRTGGSKKGSVVGSGGQRRAKLAGRGPTPPAELRPGHPAQRRAARAEASSPRSRKPPDKNAAELLVGRNPVAEALRAAVPATALYVASGVDADERLTEAVRRAADRHVSILEVSRLELDRLTGGLVHQGVALQVPPFEYAHADDLLVGEAPIVALDSVTDPRNLGAIIRSAAAFGAAGVLIPERRASGVTAVAWRASAGAAARMPVARATNLVRALTAYQKAGVTVIGLDGDSETSLYSADLSGPVCFVVGSEGRGLSRLVAERCDLRVSIPVSERVESLNAGVAASIALAETARRRSS
jgi:23S rRNA (guanosine2251-2'-O)-methyltransferase